MSAIPETRPPQSQPRVKPNTLSLLSNLPHWDGSDPAGRTIIVSCESSLEQCILLARYLPLLAGRGARVFVACPTPLIRLFAQMPGVDVITAENGMPHADLVVAIGSLPRLFNTTPATIPTFSAYLRPPTAKLDAWRQRIRPMREAGQRVVGVSLNACSDNWRDVLVRAASIQFVTLDHLELDDAAAGILLLDLVIATESPVAHLAGALGKSARVLVRHAPDPCWQRAGDDTPWYPSVRIFRQPAPGDWHSPLREVIEFLNPRNRAAA